MQRHLLLLATLLGLLSAVGSAQDRPRVLILTGANNHDWEWTSPALKRILEESGKFDVELSSNPAGTLGDAAALEGLDAFVLDYNGPRWGEPAEQHFLEAVRSGTGVVVVHAADNAFPGWTEYETLVGELWRAGTGHGRFHPFDVHIERRDHPVTATLPDLHAHPDELYHRLWRAPGANHQTLAWALSSKESGGTGERELMISVGSYGRGRVIHTPLGHTWRGQPATHASYTDPQFHTLLVRATEWAATGEVHDGLAHPNQLTAEEAAQGWRLLFDGETIRGWQGGEEGSTTQVIQGCLRRLSGAGPLRTGESFGDLEFAFEWKAAGESRATVSLAGGGSQALRFALGTARDPEAGRVEPLGTFNQSRIVLRDGHVEHWLNGEKVFEQEIDAPAPGPIELGATEGEVWYRSLRIRETSLPEATSLLVGEGLEGWSPVGAAQFTRDGDCIVGRVPEGGLGRNSFLRTTEEFADFIFEVEVRAEVPGNSGIQFRSHQREEDGIVYGYQAEIDCSPRRWSGGIYGESFGGWIDNLEDDPPAQRAFRIPEWNHYRIEARGPHLRVWVNGVPTADTIDDRLERGFFALQVHGGKQGTFRWRAPRVRRL